MRPMKRRAISQPASASSAAAVATIRAASHIIAFSCAKTVPLGTAMIAYQVISGVSATGEATAR